MSRTLIIHRPKRTHGLVKQEHILGGIGIMLYPGRDELGKPLLAGVLPDDPDAARAVKRQARLMGKVYTLGKESVVEVWTDGKPDGLFRVDSGKSGPPVPEPIPDVSPMVATALRNGWLESDLDGAGQGDDWSLKGGTGKTSGLSVAQMALVKAPPAWSQHVQTHWPWEVKGWRPPPDFDTPVVPSKLAEDEDEVTKVEDDPEDDPEDKGEPESEDKPRSLPQEAIEEILADLDPDQRAGAITVLAELVQKAGGKPPSVQKANHWIRKAGLPTLRQDALDVLLTMI